MWTVFSQMISLQHIGSTVVSWVHWFTLMDQAIIISIFWQNDASLIPPALWIDQCVSLPDSPWLATGEDCEQGEYEPAEHVCKCVASGVVIGQGMERRVHSGAGVFVCRTRWALMRHEFNMSSVYPQCSARMFQQCFFPLLVELQKLLESALLSVCSDLLEPLLSESLYFPSSICFIAGSRKDM